MNYVKQKNIKIGFIGLGKMGLPISERLNQFYSPLVISKKCSLKVSKRKKPNYTICEHYFEIADKCDLIFLCLNTIEQTNDVIHGINGLMKSKKKPKIVIDLSTSEPKNVEMNFKILKKSKILYIDSPMGRTPAHAKNGKLNLIMGVSKSKVKKIIGILDKIAENIYFTGAPGNGTKIKLLNNFYGQSVTALFNDTLNISKSINIKPSLLMNVISQGPLFSPIIGDIFKYHNFSKKKYMQFSLGNAYKDILYFMNFTSRFKYAYKDIIYNRIKKVIKKKSIDRSVGEL